MVKVMQWIVGAVLAILILGATITTIADDTLGQQGVGNITGAPSVLLGVVPILLLIGVVWVMFKSMTGR